MWPETSERLWAFSSCLCRPGAHAKRLLGSVPNADSLKWGVKEVKGAPKELRPGGEGVPAPIREAGSAGHPRRAAKASEWV